MKVLLKKDVDELGYAGEVHKVAPGYGRNYLLPRGMAVIASDGVLKAAEQWRERAAARRAELKAEFEALAARVNALTLNFSAKAGESGKLYGSVTTNDVADKLNETLGTEIDRRNVVGEALRQLGSHTVPVRLSREVQTTVAVVISLEASEEPAVEEEAEAEEAADDAVEAADDAADETE